METRQQRAMRWAREEHPSPPLRHGTPNETGISYPDGSFTPYELSNPDIKDNLEELSAAVRRLGFDVTANADLTRTLIGRIDARAKAPPNAPPRAAQTPPVARKPQPEKPKEGWTL